MKKTLTCIRCPIGCRLEAEPDGTGAYRISGNQCARGIAYAKAELTHPTRMLTSTVRIVGAPVEAAPVKSAAPLPKDRIVDCARALKDVRICAPVTKGDIIVPDVCGTGVDIVATRSLPKIKR